MGMIQRLAVLGLGSMGRKHAQNGIALGYEVVGVDPALQEPPPGISRLTNRAEALSWCDAVIIATPASCHAEDLLAAVSASRHALVEKPFAASLSRLSTALDQAERAGLVVAVAQNLRHHPAVEAARAAIAGGVAGRILSAIAIGASYLPDWRPDQDYRRNYAANPRSGGVIFDWVHEIDMLVHLLGPAKVEGAIAARERLLEMPSEEEAGLLLRHNGGAISTLLLSYTTRPALRRTMLLGPERRIEIDIPSRRMLVLNGDGSVVDDHAFGGRHEDDYRRELADFLESVEMGRTPRCPGREGLTVLETVLGARRLAGLPGQEET